MLFNILLKDGNGKNCIYANISQLFGGVQKCRFVGDIGNFERVYLLLISAEICSIESRRLIYNILCLP